MKFWIVAFVIAVGVGFGIGYLTSQKNPEQAEASPEPSVEVSEDASNFVINVSGSYTVQLLDKNKLVLAEGDGGDTLTDDVDGSTMPVSTNIWYEKPESGMYYIQIDGAKTAETVNMELILYDRAGEFKKIELPLKLVPGKPTLTELQYSKSHLTTSSVVLSSLDN